MKFLFVAFLLLLFKQGTCQKTTNINGEFFYIYPERQSIENQDKGYFDKKLHDGNWVKYYKESKTIYLTGSIKNNKKTGLWQWYNNKGVLIYKCYFVDQLDLFKGNVRYYDDGNIYSEQKIEDSILADKYYYRNRNTMSVSYYSKDFTGYYQQPYGNETYFYENGNLKQETYWYPTLIHCNDSVHKTNFLSIQIQDGALVSSLEIWSEYYSNGKTKTKYSFTDSPYKIVFLSYDEDGLLKESGALKLSLKNRGVGWVEDGLWINYSKNLIKEVYYYDNGVKMEIPNISR